MAYDIAKLTSALLSTVGENSEGTEPSSWLDMGYLPLNKMISGDPTRGFAAGRMYEIAGPSASGKTLLATQAMIAAQQAGGFAIFIDWEQTFNQEFATRLGMNCEAPFFTYKRAETWEEGNTVAMKAADALRKAGVPMDVPIVVVLDSIAAAVPKSMLYDSKGVRRGIDEYTMNDTTALARVTSTTLKSINQLVGKLNVTCIYLNQIRTKPGVCLRYDAPVLLADGSTEKIGKLVHAREPVQVVAYNVETGKLEHRPIVQFHRNKHDGKWVQVVTAGGKNGRRSAFFTPEHEVHTSKGWVRADAISVGDSVTTVDLEHYTKVQHEIILGSLLGDGQVRFGDGKNPNSEKGRLRLVHGTKQAGYLAWKAKLLGIHEPRFTSLHCYADSASSMEFMRYRTVEKFKALLAVPDSVIGKITPLTVAIWFMDDGTYSAKSGGLKYGEGRYCIDAKKLDAETLQKIASHISSIGLGTARVKEGKGLIWSGEQAKLFGEAIAQYVPSCMGYKLNRKITASGDDLQVERQSPRRVVYTNKVLSVSHTQGTESKDKYKYDIGVEGVHTFVAGGGIVVHNCYGDPTTTPGGGAMEFYATTRLFTGRKREMETKDGEKIMKAALIGVESKKNKLNRPFLHSELRLAYKEDGLAYFDFTTGYIEALCDMGKLEEKAGRVTWGGKTYWKAQLAKKIDEEGLQAELVKMYLS